MMLKTSSNSVNPATNMFKICFKRNLGIIILVTLGTLLICPSYLLVDLSDSVNKAKIDEISGYLGGWIYGFSFFASLFTAFGVTALNLLNFSFMYKRPASDMYDSLPITRIELFFSRTLSSVLLILIPVIFASGSLSIVALFYGCPKLILDVLSNFLYIVTVTLVASAFSMVFIITSASVFDFLVSYIGINVGIILMGIIGCSLCERTLYGYSDRGYNSVLNLISPPYYMFTKYYEFVNDEAASQISLRFLARSIIYILAFAVISILLYKKRKTESSGKAFAYKFMYLLCSFVISFCASYAFGAIFADEDIKSVIFYLFAAAGAAIVAVSYGAITHRGFKTVKSSLVMAGVAFASMVLIIVLVKLDITGFNTRVPETKNIKTACVTYRGENINFNNPEKIVSLHKNIVNNIPKNYDDHDYPGNTIMVDLVYNLKSGKTMKRSYYVSANDLLSESTSEILRSEERFSGLLDDLENGMPNTVDATMFDNNSMSEETNYSTYLTYSEVVNLIKIYKNEVNSKKLPVLDFETSKQISVSWHSGRYHGFELALSDNNTETFKYLDSLNLKKRSEEKAEEVVLYD